MKCNQVWYGSKIRAKIFSFKAYGFFRYISDGFNVFDGVIVIFSCLEIYNSFVYGLESGENSGISVLRTFRLLREEDFHIMSSFLNKFVEEMSLLQKRKKNIKVLLLFSKILVYSGRQSTVATGNSQIT